MGAVVVVAMIVEALLLIAALRWLLSGLRAAPPAEAPAVAPLPRPAVADHGPVSRTIARTDQPVPVAV